MPDRGHGRVHLKDDLVVLVLLFQAPDKAEGGVDVPPGVEGIPQDEAELGTDTKCLRPQVQLSEGVDEIMCLGYGAAITGEAHAARGRRP